MDTIPSEAAVQLVYLIAGAESAIKNERATNRVLTGQGHSDFADLVGGHIGMTREFLPLSKILAGYIASLQKDQDFPGVFEYEVTEPLGEWLVRNWGNFTPDSFLAETVRQGTLFFTQSIEFNSNI